MVCIDINKKGIGEKIIIQNIIWYIRDTSKCQDIPSFKGTFSSTPGSPNYILLKDNKIAVITTVIIYEQELKSTELAQKGFDFVPICKIDGVTDKEGFQTKKKSFHWFHWLKWVKMVENRRFYLSLPILLVHMKVILICTSILLFYTYTLFPCIHYY